jgi:hypothetical protein
LLTESVERDPDYLSAFEGLTSAYQLSGNSEKARWAAENVMRINPKFSIDTEENKWPFKDEAFKKRHFDALRSAGLK